MHCPGCGGEAAGGTVSCPRCGESTVAVRHAVPLPVAGLRLANACACCLAPPTTSIPFQSAKVVWGGLQKTGTMRVPMCGDCTRDRTELIKWVSIVSFVLAGVLAFFVANALVPKARDPEQDQGMLRVLLMVGIAGAGGGLGRLLASRTKKSARPGHTA